VFVQVMKQHAGQDGRDGDDADGAVRALLEAAEFMRRSSAGPGGANTRAGGGEDDLPAAVIREDEIIVAQGDGFLWAQRRVVQAAEERGKLRPDTVNLGQIARTCAGLATAALGACHCTTSIGLAGSSPSSTE